LDEGTHPFHLHGHKFWVMAQGDGNFNYSMPLDPNPVTRDTVSLRKSALGVIANPSEGYGFTLIRFVSDNPGAWAFHCHISWHMEAGLLMTILEGAGGKLDAMVAKAPPQWNALCSAT